MEWIADPQAWISLTTLTLLEIVLGIDNIVFISVLAGRLPKEERAKARVVGLSLAMITRILLLLSLSWMMKLTKPLFTLLSFEVTGRDIILITGGLFLIWKSTFEIHHQFEGEAEQKQSGKRVSYRSVLMQILLLDIVFSLDSVITAVGLANQISVMVLAIVISVLIMLFASRPISEFVDRHPTVKMLALSFLILIGVTLVAEGSGLHIPKGYVYFAMAFSLAVEVLNINMHKKRRIVQQLRKDIPFS